MVNLLLCAASAQWTFRVCFLYSYLVHDLWYICFSVQRVLDGHLEFGVFIVICSMIYGRSASLCSECTMDI
jgi:hypothetical protein